MALKCHLHIWRQKLLSGFPYILLRSKPDGNGFFHRLSVRPGYRVSWSLWTLPAWEEEMKRKKRSMYPSDASREQEVKQEIENFLHALSSYPDRFAREPRLSFQEHLFDIEQASHQVPDPRRTLGH